MSLSSVWFWLAVASLAVYAVLDGFDLGVGIIQPFVAKTPFERKLISQSIGPVWDGNEVWLLASGGTMVFAFPKLYAIGISGFYLPVTILLWLLGVRALGIELRHHFDHPLWEEIWAVAFWGASLLIALFLSVALGNVLRGVSMNEDGRFFSALWTDFGVGEKTGILDVYTIGVGVFGVAVIAHHGALWLAARTSGPTAERAEKLSGRLFLVVVALGVLVSAATLKVQPQLLVNITHRPWGAVLPIAAGISLAVAKRAATRGRWTFAFRASCAFLASAFASAAYGVFPYVLPARIAERGLTADAASTNDYGLRVGFLWWIPGMLLATFYFVRMYRRLPAKISAADLDDHH
jgi:cytochrome d ubiquinol oxidase subunit II